MVAAEARYWLDVFYIEVGSRGSAEKYFKNVDGIINRSYKQFDPQVTVKMEEENISKRWELLGGIVLCTYPMLDKPRLYVATVFGEEKLNGLTDNLLDGIEARGMRFGVLKTFFSISGNEVEDRIKNPSSIQEDQLVAPRVLRQSRISR